MYGKCSTQHNPTLTYLSDVNAFTAQIARAPLTTPALVTNSRRRSRKCFRHSTPWLSRIATARDARTSHTSENFCKTRRLENSDTIEWERAGKQASSSLFDTSARTTTCRYMLRYFMLPFWNGKLYGVELLREEAFFFKFLMFIWIQKREKREKSEH